MDCRANGEVILRVRRPSRSNFCERHCPFIKMDSPGCCHYQQRFLDKVAMSSMSQQRQESLAFEHRHNSAYRYSKIKRKTPLKALAGIEKKLVFPSKSHAPRHPLDKPEEGCYHLVRFIRSDCRLNIFGEMFSAPPETQYEYVVTTIDVKEQKLKLFLDAIQVEEYNYQLR